MRGVCGFLIVSGLAICLAAVDARADMVVLRAKGPGLVPGQVVSTGASIVLPAGSRAVLLAREGRTVALNGPFSGVVDEPAGGLGGDAKTVSVLSRLLSPSAADSSALGGTRLVDVASPYAIAITGGIHCQVAGEKPRFEREGVRPKLRLTVTSSSGAHVSQNWGEDVSELAWPPKLPFTAGTYRLGFGSQHREVDLTVVMVPAQIKDPIALAVWMAEHDCSAQASRLLAGLR